MYFQHCPENFGGRANIPHSPARHGECLAKTRNQHGAFRHTVERRNRNMPPRICQFGVNFVGYGDKVVFFYNGANRFELGFIEHRSCGIIGIWKYYSFGFFRYSRLDSLRRGL